MSNENGDGWPIGEPRIPKPKASKFNDLLHGARDLAIAMRDLDVTRLSNRELASLLETTMGLSVILSTVQQETGPAGAGR